MRRILSSSTPLDHSWGEYLAPRNAFVLSAHHVFLPSAPRTLSHIPVMQGSLLTTIDGKQGSDYLAVLKRQSSLELIRRVVVDSDQGALEVLLDTRRLFRAKGAGPLLFTEYLRLLRENLLHPGNPTTYELDWADCAYDLTVAKYSNLPDAGLRTQRKRAKDEWGTEIDCRKYYRAVMLKVQKRLERTHTRSQIEEERLVCWSLQRLVYRNFLYSKAECRRRYGSWRRYDWEVKAARIRLYYPRHLTAAQFRRWLEKNLEDVDPSRRDEKQRIQAIIDEKLTRVSQVPPDDPLLSDESDETPDLSVVEYDEGMRFIEDLAEAVAGEKSRGIGKLRPGIRKIGGEALEQLILEIFFDLAEGGYNGVALAAKYGLSKATVSRFAGCDWKKNAKKGKMQVPDLWQNTARTLSGSRAFMQTVICCGFEGKLKEMLLALGERKDHGKRG